MDHDRPQGLAVTDDGYTMVPATVELTPGTSAPLTFEIVGHDGKRAWWKSCRPVARELAGFCWAEMTA